MLERELPIVDIRHISTKVTAAVPKTGPLSQFSQVPVKMPSPTYSKKLSREYDDHVSKWCVWFLVILWVTDICFHLGEYRNIQQKDNY